jgi:GntR family transcriptional regulator of abcA and norABC
VPPRTPRGTVRALVAQLVEEIGRGVWPPESRLPPERTLAERLGLHRSTVAAAYDELAARGLVVRRQGSGTFVKGDLWGLAPDWRRYLEPGAFRPTESLVRAFREGRLRPGVADMAGAELGPSLRPTSLLASLVPPGSGEEVLGYPPAAGIPALREAVAAGFAQRWGRMVGPEAVLVTSGAEEAIYLIARALLRPGDAIVLERPSFLYSLSLFQSAGLRLLPVATDDAGVVPEDLERVVRLHRPAMVWLNPTFHNPTTTTLSAARREAVLEVCRRWNLPVVEDDAFRDLVLEGAPPPPPPLLALAGGHRVIHIGTLSKVAAPGLRVGWVVAPRPVLERLADLKSQIDLGTPGIVQAWAARLLSAPAWAAHLQGLARALRLRLEAFRQAATPLAEAGAAFTWPEGGLYVWVRWPDPTPDRVRLANALRAGVAFAPGRVFGADDGYARLNYAALPPARAAEALSRLADLCAERPGRRLGRIRPD